MIGHFYLSDDTARLARPSACKIQDSQLNHPWLNAFLHNRAVDVCVRATMLSGASRAVAHSDSPVFRDGYNDPRV